MSMQPYSPMDELSSWRDINRFLSDAISFRPHSIGELMHRITRQIDLYETDNGYEIHFPIAGAQPDSIEVTVHNNVVTTSWETAAQTPPNARQVWSGIQHGRFQEQISLPVELDANTTSANYENGVLYIHLAKATQGISKTIKVSKSQGH